MPLVVPVVLMTSETLLVSAQRRSPLATLQHRPEPPPRRDDAAWGIN